MGGRGAGEAVAGTGTDNGLAVAGVLTNGAGVDFAGVVVVGAVAGGAAAGADFGCVTGTGFAGTAAGEGFADATATGVGMLVAAGGADTGGGVAGAGVPVSVPAWGAAIDVADAGTAAVAGAGLAPAGATAVADGVACGLADGAATDPGRGAEGFADEISVGTDFTGVPVTPEGCKPASVRPTVARIVAAASLFRTFRVIDRPGDFKRPNGAVARAGGALGAAAAGGGLAAGD